MSLRGGKGREGAMTGIPAPNRNDQSHPQRRVTGPRKLAIHALESDQCEALPMKPVVYGIRNCDTVKKARAWLDARGIAYDFHDYKIAAIDEARLRGWAKELGWKKLLNRAGTTFRKLPDADKDGLDEDKAIALMLAQPSMIKRPVVDLGDWLLLGFKEGEYEAAFAP
jgi:arsenate reductase (glutaredoxin)